MSTPDLDSSNYQQSNSNFGVGHNSKQVKGPVAGKVEKQVNYNDYSTTNTYMSGSEKSSVKDSENTNQDNKNKIIRSGDLVKSTANFQGREKDIATLMGWLKNKNVRLIGIQAIAGMGKSTLAAKLYESKKLPLQKAYWVNVIAAPSFAIVAQNIFKEFGWEKDLPAQEQDYCEALIKKLRAESCLLVIDNLESLLTETKEKEWASTFWQDFFLKWNEYGHNSKVLVTSREQPKSPIFDKWLSLAGLEEDAGVALLKVKNIQGDLKAFVEKIGGHPLLLKIAADFLYSKYHKSDREPSLDDLPDELQDLLTDEKAQATHHGIQQCLAAVLKPSFQRLSKVQQEIFLAASVFRKQFNAEMVRAASEIDLAIEAIDKELQEIEEISLLEFSWDKTHKERWYSFHPVMQEYARYKAGTNEKAHRNVINFYQSKANKDQESWRTLKDILEYFEIAHYWLVLENIDQAFISIKQCDDFLKSRGYYITLIKVYQLIVMAYEKLDQSQKTEKYGEALTKIGDIYLCLGEYEKTILYSQKGLDIAVRRKDQKGLACSFRNLGVVHCLLEQYEQAIQFHLQHLAVAREISDQTEEARSLINLCNTYVQLKEWEQALGYAQQSLEIARKINDQTLQVKALHNLGFVYEGLGDFEKALDLYQESLDIYKKIGDRYGEANSLMILSSIYGKIGRFKDGFIAHQQGHKIIKEMKLPLNAYLFYPEWIKSIIRFAQKGKFQFILLFIGGVLVFPFVLIWRILAVIYHLMRRPFLRG